MIIFLETSPPKTVGDFFRVIQQGFGKTKLLISFLLELVPAMVLFKARLTRVMMKWHTLYSSMRL